MKSIKIEFIFLFVTLFAGIIANTGIAKESEIRKDSHAMGYPHPYPYPNATPPKVNSITRGSVNPTDLTSVNFTVIFSKDVIGVDIKDFFLSTTGITGASITSVIPSPSSASFYGVIVNTGTGRGTIRLNVLDNDTIVDGSGNPLGGLGAHNGNFTNGETYLVRPYKLFLPLLLR